MKLTIEIEQKSTDALPVTSIYVDGLQIGLVEKFSVQQSPNHCATAQIDFLNLSEQDKAKAPDLVKMISAYKDLLNKAFWVKTSP